jgi:hypothetical protein
MFAHGELFIHRDGHVQGSVDQPRLGRIVQDTGLTQRCGGDAELVCAIVAGDP